MLNFKDREWREFVFQDIFVINRGEQGVYKQDMQTGHIPYVSATARNNGISTYIDVANRPRNMMSLAYDGSIGATFYQGTKWFASEKVVSIALKNHKLNRYIALFLCPLIERQKIKYGYAYKWSVETRMMRGKILLPSVCANTPDWQFMEDYTREREQRQLKEYFTHANNMLAEIGDIESILPLKEKKWKPFVLSSIFTLETGKDKGLNHLTQTPDGISYLGATNRNNGVLCFVEPNDKLIQPGNGIAFIRNGEGSIGYSVYKATPFIASSDLTIGYSDKLNRYSGAFITTIADTVRGKYNFSYKRSEKRLSKEFLNLPINESGEPDWLYMEQYAKTITQLQLKAYLRHKGEQ